MNLTFKLALVFFLLLTLSCKERHLFSDQSELATVTRDFEDKQKALPHGDLFRIFTTSLTTEEREALMFLYAYMPIGAITCLLSTSPSPRAGLLSRMPSSA